MDNQRRAFVACASMEEDSLSALCREYGISRPTGYKWYAGIVPYDLPRKSAHGRARAAIVGADAHISPGNDSDSPPIPVKLAYFAGTM